jgi:hypothetical protein
MTEGNRQREQESKRAQYRPRPLEQDNSCRSPCRATPRLISQCGPFWANSADQWSLTCRHTFGVEHRILGQSLLSAYGTPWAACRRGGGLEPSPAFWSRFTWRYTARKRLADAGRSGGRCKACWIQSNRVQGHFWQNKAELSKGGPLAGRVGLPFLAERASGCADLGSHLGVKASP